MLYEIVTFLFWPILIYVSYRACVFALKKFDPESVEKAE